MKKSNYQILLSLLLLVVLPLTWHHSIEHIEEHDETHCKIRLHINDLALNSVDAPDIVEEQLLSFYTTYLNSEFHILSNEVQFIRNKSPPSFNLI